MDRPGLWLLLYLSLFWVPLTQLPLDGHPLSCFFFFFLIFLSVIFLLLSSSFFFFGPDLFKPIRDLARTLIWNECVRIVDVRIGPDMRHTFLAWLDWIVRDEAYLLASSFLLMEGSRFLGSLHSAV